MGEMIELPQVRELKASIERLRESIAEAICTEEYLLHVKGREIEMTNRLAFYDMEIEILEARCRLLVLARKREKYLAGNTVAGKIAEARMDEILGQWEGELARKKALLTEARGWKARPAGKDDVLDSLMISLIKARHPALNPEDGDEKFMAKAVVAFREGDEKALQVLLNEAKNQGSKSPPERLLEEEKRLNHLLLGYRKNVAAIKQRPPFTEAFDSQGREARRRELIKEIERLKKVQEKEEAAFKALLGGTKLKRKEEDEN